MFLFLTILSSLFSQKNSLTFSHSIQNNEEKGGGLSDVLDEISHNLRLELSNVEL